VDVTNDAVGEGKTFVQVFIVETRSN